MHASMFSSAAGLLERLPEWAAAEHIKSSGHPLSAWALMLEITEDEDEGVRKAAARSLGGSLSRIGREDLSWACLDHVQRRCFESLSDICGTRPEYVQQLLRWIRR